MGAGSHLARLFTGRHKSSGTKNIIFQPYFPSRIEAVADGFLTKFLVE